MKITFYTLYLSFLTSQYACTQNPTSSTSDSPKITERSVGGACECCEAWQEGLPGNLNWHSNIAPPGEAGDPLQINGTIFHKDGKTPAEGVILYVYHTDHEGNYSRGKGSECARRHGLLRGWVKTGPDGRYSFKTIRPASYPGTTIEQHIHPIVKEPGLKAYWIDEFLFDDDPNLSARARNNQQKRGGPGILTLSKNEEGIWIASRDIVLGMNVPGYQ